MHKGEKVVSRAEVKASESGTNNNVYLTVNYNGSGPLDEQQMDMFAAFLNKRLGQAMTGGA